MVSNTVLLWAGWFTLALINTGLAQIKGRSALMYFVLSIVLGPLATLVAVLPSPPWQNRRRTAPSTESPAS